MLEMEKIFTQIFEMWGFLVYSSVYMKIALKIKTK